MDADGAGAAAASSGAPVMGSTRVEYALIVALIALLVILGLVLAR